MSKVIEISTAASFSSAQPVGSHLKTTADYRRLLCDMRMRPWNQRAFLRKLLQRAAANGVRSQFLIPFSAVATP